jgi:PKD repeat protein
VSFTDTSTNNPTSWLWDFGDGATSTQRNPSHTYASANTYSVTLTATNGGGSDDRTRNVQVSDPPGGVVYAADAFGRTVTNAWGTADVGGAYTVQNTAGNYDVAAGFGTMVLPSGGAMRSALLNGVSARDIDITFQVSANETANGGAYWVYGVARRNGTNEYRPKIHVYSDGRVGVHAGRVINNSETSIAPEVIVAGLTFAADTQINVRAQVTGTGTTTIRVKAWAEGQTEPAGWQFTATDTNANLQSAGSVGLRVYIGGNVSNAPVTFSFDDYSVTAP